MESQPLVMYTIHKIKNPPRFTYVVIQPTQINKSVLTLQMKMAIVI